VRVGPLEPARPARVDVEVVPECDEVVVVGVVAGISLEVVRVAVVVDRPSADAAARDQVNGDPDRAFEFAGNYARSGPQREAIEVMLLGLSEDYSRIHPVDRLILMGRYNGCYVDAPNRAGDPVNSLQQRRIDRLFEGVEYLRRRGRRQCLRCDVQLARDNKDLHCVAHNAFDSVDRATLQTTLRDVAQQLGIDTDGPKSRRLRRGSRV
jgi:hypothetical protein